MNVWESTARRMQDMADDLLAGRAVDAGLLASALSIAAVVLRRKARLVESTREHISTQAYMPAERARSNT